MKLTRFALIAAMITAVMAPAGFGHHSFAMFELTKDVTYEGTMVEYRWENPHTHFIVKVEGTDPATAGTWDVEGGSTNIMGRQGWTRATLKPGDRVKLVAHPMKDGSKGASLFYAVMPYPGCTGCTGGLAPFDALTSTAKTSRCFSTMKSTSAPCSVR